MPIRQGGYRLWFNTKEEQDEYDDKMIASVTIQTEEYEDRNFTPVFFRKRQESHLNLSEAAAKQIRSFQNIFQNYSPDLYGKRDHTYWRDISTSKYLMTYVVGYLLLRELPVRNFYARAWIMAFGAAYALETFNGWVGKGVRHANDPFLYKDIKNYRVYEDLKAKRYPTHDNKLPEQKLWRLNQPGHMDIPTSMSLSTALTALPNMLFAKDKVIPWDGSFNMPVYSLASPRHKDAQWIDFLYA